MATITANLPKVVDINWIEVLPDRRKVEIEDARKMAESIKEHGLIQPIVLAHTVKNPHGIGDRYQLVAGGHRLAAMRIMGWQYLTHYEHYIIRDEDANTDDGKFRLAAVELEENLRRKEMSWSETVEAKARLMEYMEKIHGQTGAGRPNARERAAGEVDGFGVRKLAAMLGESVGTVSQDLQLARMVRAMPSLAKAESKSSAARQGTIQVALHAIKTGQAKAASTNPPASVGEAKAPAAQPTPAPMFELYEGKWEDHIAKISDSSIDLVYTDLPYGVNLDQMSSHDKGALSYNDSRIDVVSMLPRLCNQAFRVLKDARYAIFWFGFNYYSDLLVSLKHAGFDYNPVPVVWIKHRQATENPVSRYANGYEQAIVAWKGAAKFIRPGRANIVDIPGVAVGAKLQNAQQPVELVENFIKDMLLVGTSARVLDFCSGSGTTGVAAIQQGCYPILFERNNEQCLISRQRMTNAKRNPAI